ncbi:putative alpha beta hydrolase [Diplodia seriata]|uniref:Putative alpha beta hydrolase n=1 Tax=Diplodia seriata TaxID=420778 RepID=A0A0G2EZ65_9PEZI|nr:putative alpha beta hydrolase [Diplodia seriata]
MPPTPTPSSLHLTPHTIPTTHGTIHVLDTGTPSPSPSPLPTLLLLHGNSSHSHIFLPLIALSRSSPSLQRHRILALDLPGHGASSDAPDEKSYTQPAYGDAALQVLEALGHVNLAGTEHWSARDFDTFPFEAARGERAPWIRAAAVRTDGRARRVMFDAFEAGRGADQVRVVAETAVPCAVVNGADEPFVNLDYLDELAYGNLWEGRCHRLPGLGHAPFWEQPEAFLPYWERFVRDCSGGSSGEA